MDSRRDKPPVGLIFAIMGVLVLVVWIPGSFVAYRYYQNFQKEVTAAAGNPVSGTGYSVAPSKQAEDPPAAPMKPLPDSDALAARFSARLPLYQQTSKEALAGWAALHPEAHSYDEEARGTLRLLAFLETCGDYYGEGLWQQAGAHISHLRDQGANFTIFSTMLDTHTWSGKYSSSAEGAKSIHKDVLDLATSKYPARFKLEMYRFDINNLISASKDPAMQLQLDEPLADLPKLVDLVRQSYADLLRAHYPPKPLYYIAADLFDGAQGSDTTVKALDEAIASAFAAEDKDNPVAQTIHGDFYISYAWSARGSGWSNSVSEEGWRLFGERLDKADEILQQNYEAHPETPCTARAMMTVVLGKNESRDEMEKWFQRGLKQDPHGFDLYMAKRWFLLPRWSGSDEDVRDFGLECAKSTDWDAKIPLMLVECLDDAAERDPGVYQPEENWKPVEQVFRGYLDHYPASTVYRSRFLKCAVEGGHWDVAAEQIKILGDDWDRGIFEADSYAKVKALLAEHASGK